MLLLIIRHGEANNPVLDPKKGLSEKGVRQAEKIAGFLRKQQSGISEIWHSPKQRAFQTAGVIAEILEPEPALVKRNNLNPENAVEPVVQDLEMLDRNLIIVSHLPFVDRLASFLATYNYNSSLFKFSTCGSVCLEKSDSSFWRIRWVISPENLG
ncbi:MAG: phosphohistidine phosphatase SixA [FCB group bacterium]|nr:phosphohistidine phosphatase SixA [FCB group bacterium]